MDTAVQKLVEQAPWAAAMLGLTWMLLRSAERERAERVTSAKEKSEKDRETQVIIAKSYADAINNLALIITDMKSTMIEQYRNMGITQDLLDIATKRLKEQERTRK